MKNTLGLSAPPLQSPLLQQNAHPQASGAHTEYAAVPWSNWFHQAYQRLVNLPVLEDLHGARATYSPERFNNFLLKEIDRGWTYASLLATAAGTVDTAGTAVTWKSGAKFDANWPGSQIVINHVLYVVAAVATDTALTLAASAGAQTDVGYASTATSTGTIDTAGTAVTWKTGVKFQTSWIGAQIMIAGASYMVAAVASATALTLSASAGAHTDATYNVGGYVWAYHSGIMHGAFSPDQRPTDLDMLDTGALFHARDVAIVWRWDGAKWKYYAGHHVDVKANQPAALTADDAGYLYLATDEQTTYEWDGAAWVSYGGGKAAADFVPVVDGGASLGSFAARFLNLYLKGQISLGMAGPLVENYLADLRGADAAKPAVLHLNATDADAGLYLVADGDTTHLTAGAVYDGTNWIAKAAVALILTINPATNALVLVVNSGLTIGASFVPTPVFAIDLTGKVTLCASIDSAAYKAGGTAAEAATVITYLTGTPAAGQSSKTVTFKQGLQTAHT